MRGEEYFRLEPFPFDRIKGIAKTQHLCAVCVLGQEEVDRITREKREAVKNHWTSMGSSSPVMIQQTLNLDDPITIVRASVEVINITPSLLSMLMQKPEHIYSISPNAFEDLICERLGKMNFGIERVGTGTNHKDGGIDFVAWPKASPFPFLIAIQAKHHRSPRYKTGPSEVRDLLGVVQTLPFNAGVLVTNTTFTADAKWVAQQKPSLIRLRDITDVKKWIEDNFLDEYDWREMPEFIEVCRGVTIQLPKSTFKRM